MTPKHYPEVTSFRGFAWVLGWVAGQPCDQVRVLGTKGDEVRVEWIDRKGRPRDWLPLAEPRFSGLRAWIAKAPPWPNPGGVAEVPTGDRQGTLFGARG